MDSFFFKSQKYIILIKIRFCVQRECFLEINKLVTNKF